MSSLPSAVDFRDLNDPELLRQVAQLRKTDNYTNWLYIVREYLGFALVIGMTVWFYYQIPVWGISWLWAAPVTITCITIVGAMQHRLVTFSHEAAHYILFRNRTLNELVSEWFCMFPVLGVTHPYRVQHLGHHQYPNDPERDPDWTQLRASGHRYSFPMSKGRFLWECVLKQILWPPKPIAYVVVRALQKIDQGGSSPYRMKRRPDRRLVLGGLTYTLGLIASLVWLVWRGDERLLLVPAGIWVAALAFFSVVPGRWFGEYFIQSDLPARFHACMRATFYFLLWTGLAWLSLRLQMPLWFFYLVLWVVPLGTSFAFFMILRQLVQHGNADQGRISNTRNFEINPLLNFAIFPIGNDYHIPHHLFPMIPHYNLRKAHALLLKAEIYRRQAIMVEGYFFHRRPPKHTTVLELISAQQEGSQPSTS